MKPDAADIQPQVIEAQPLNEVKPEVVETDPLIIPTPIIEGNIADEAPYGRKADGTPRAKPGRKPGSGGSDTGHLDSVTPPPPRRDRISPGPKAPVIAVDYPALGRVAAELWFKVPQLFVGQEWEPEEGEPQLIADSFATYFKAKGINDLPPGVVLSVVLTSYTMARITKPTIMDRIKKAGSWLKNKLPTFKR